MKTTSTLKSLLTLLLIVNTQFIIAQASTWTVINKTNSSLPSDTVNAIAIDKFGTKWFGTENGLAKWSNGVWTIYKKSNSGIPSNKISSITIDSLGNKWIGTRGMGLAMFDGITWTLFNTNNSLVLGRNVGGVAIDSLNNKWVVSNMLTKIGPTNLSLSGWSVPYCSSVSHPDTVMNCIAIDPLDIKWMGSSLSGVYFCSNTFMQMNSSGAIKSICIKGNNIWMGGDIGFLIPGSVTSCGNFNFQLHYPSEMQLTSGTVTAISVDDCGYAWVGTKSGLGRYTGVASTTLGLTTSNTPLPSNQIKCIFTKGNEKWIGTTKGVALLNTGCQYQYTHTTTTVFLSENDLDENQIAVFPNPGQNEITIQLPQYTSYNISITDFLGREVLTAKAENGNIKIDLSGCANGVYYVKAYNSTHTLTGKILKE